MTEKPEQRGSDRIPVGYRAEVQYQGDKIGEATITDLSDSGLQFHTEHNLEPGSRLLLKVGVGHSRGKPLILSASVVRVWPSTEGPGYLVGCTIE